MGAALSGARPFPFPAQTSGGSRPVALMNQRLMNQRLAACALAVPHHCLTEAPCGGWLGRLGDVENDVADIFPEVDEEVRREQLKKLWAPSTMASIATATLSFPG